MMNIGDKIRIIKKFKSKEIDYLSIMDKYIGQVGEFVGNDIDNTRIIKFSDGESFIWYPECLELVEDYKDKTTEKFDEVSEGAYRNCEDLKPIEYLDELEEELEKSKRFMTIEDCIIEECENLKNLLLEKNRKYGNSIQERGILFDLDPVIAIKSNINNKLARWKNQNHDEDEDITQDLLGYLIHLRIALR